MTTTLQAMSTHPPGSTLVDAAAARMYAAEIALHEARQSHIDAWIAAAYDTLHRTIAEHRAAVKAAQPIAAPVAG
jgi:hypothetical protein